MKFSYVLAYDLETTGFSPKEHEILEIGVAAWNVATGEEVSGSCLFRPRFRIPDHIAKLTGITEATLREEGVHDRNEILTGFEELTNRADVLVVGHNIRKFDNPFMRRAGVRIAHRRTWDTLLQMRADMVAKRRYSFLETQLTALNYGGKLRTNLAAAAAFYGVEGPKNRHRAKADAETALRIFKAQLARNRWQILAARKQ